MNPNNPADPHTQIRSTVAACQVHNRHIPAPHINHRHHIWPLGEGGPDIEDNIVVVCATGHYSIHDLLSHYKMYQGNPPYTVLKRYAFGERKYAKLGYDRITRKSM